MGQARDDLQQVIGYALKHAQAALRARMDETLRPLGLTAPQYACLELLSRTPGISSSDLARSAFVTRQTMNTLLQGLQDRGLVVRADQASSGRVRPARLSDEGARLLAGAAQRVHAVDEQMLAGLTVDQRRELHQHLEACIAALDASSTAPAR